MCEKLPVICPTSQAECLRHVGTTGKSAWARRNFVNRNLLVSRTRRSTLCGAPQIRDLCFTNHGPRISSASRP
jgi:hypothetical protein